MPGHQLGSPGYHVLRIPPGPWFVAFNPGGLNVGDPISIPVDPRLLTAEGLKASGTLINAGMFQFQVRQGNPPTTETLLQASVWTFAGDGYRQAVLSAFDQFLQDAEKLEGSTLRPGATEALRALVAPRIPATYAESLYFSYGVFSQGNPARSYVDVQPGMRLGVEFEEWQFVPPDATMSPLSGFVGGATAVTDVVSQAGPSGAPRLGLDAFFAAVRPPQITGAGSGAGGVVDLVTITAGVRHLRACYPVSFPSADGSGVAGPLSNVALLGAPDLATLATATTSYYDRGDAGASLVGWFRGRAVLRTHIPLLVNGTQRYVPVGTTVRHLLEPWVLPRLPGIVDGNGSAALNYRRYLPSLGLAQLYDQHAYPPVMLADGDGPDSSGADVLDLPVLAGDALRMPRPGPGP